MSFATCQAESGTSVAEIICKLGIIEQTFHRWRKRFAGLGIAELRRCGDRRRGAADGGQAVPGAWLIDCRSSGHRWRRNYRPVYPQDRLWEIWSLLRQSRSSGRLPRGRASGPLHGCVEYSWSLFSACCSYADSHTGWCGRSSAGTCGPAFAPPMEIGLRSRSWTPRGGNGVTIFQYWRQPLPPSSRQRAV